MPALSENALPGSAAPEPAGTPPDATRPPDPTVSPAGDPLPAAAPSTPTSPGGSVPAPGPPPAGLREQLARTIWAARRLLGAHVALARLELAAVGREIGQLAGKLAAALALVILFVGILVPVGSALFLGEWLFGSMAWGIAQGALGAIALAVVLVISALRVSTGRIIAATLLAFVVGLLVAVSLGLGWAHEGWRALGDSVLAGVDPANRLLLAAVLFTGGLLAVIGLLVGARLAAPGERVMGAVFGLLAGVVAGALVGALTAISYTLQVAIAVAVVVGLVCWSIFGLLTLRGHDWEAFRNRFIPSATIDNTQETLEWIRTRIPGRKA